MIVAGAGRSVRAARRGGPVVGRRLPRTTAAQHRGPAAALRVDGDRGPGVAVRRGARAGCRDRPVGVHRDVRAGGRLDLSVAGPGRRLAGDRELRAAAVGAGHAHRGGAHPAGGRAAPARPRPRRVGAGGDHPARGRLRQLAARLRLLAAEVRRQSLGHRADDPAERPALRGDRRDAAGVQLPAQRPRSLPAARVQPAAEERPGTAQQQLPDDRPAARGGDHRAGAPASGRAQPAERRAVSQLQGAPQERAVPHRLRHARRRRDSRCKGSLVHPLGRSVRRVDHRRGQHHESAHRAVDRPDARNGDAPRDRRRHGPAGPSAPD